MNQFKGFFDSNPKDFFNLIGNADPIKFYEMVEEQAQKNLEEEKDIQLTKNQLIDIIVKLNGKSVNKKEEMIIDGFMFKSEYGNFSLN